MSDRMPVKTAQTVFDVVETLLELDGARFSRLVEHTGMVDSTLHDHLRSLQTMGLVVKEGEEYVVGTRFLEMGELVRHQRDVFGVGRPEVEKLSAETGEHASLLVEERGKGVLLFIDRGEDAVNLDAHAGQRFPLSANAPGKAILANLPEDRVTEVLETHGLPQYTPETITDPEELDNELAAIREQGYATDDGELILGVKAIAAPILGDDTVHGAISIGGPRNRMSGERFADVLPDLLLRASNIIELNLAHS